MWGPVFVVFGNAMNSLFSWDDKISLLAFHLFQIIGLSSSFWRFRNFRHFSKSEQIFLTKTVKVNRFVPIFLNLLIDLEMPFYISKNEIPGRPTLVKNA